MWKIGTNPFWKTEGGKANVTNPLHSGCYWYHVNIRKTKSQSELGKERRSVYIQQNLMILYNMGIVIYIFISYNYAMNDLILFEETDDTLKMYNYRIIKSDDYKIIGGWVCWARLNTKQQ